MENDEKEDEGEQKQGSARCSNRKDKSHPDVGTPLPLLSFPSCFFLFLTQRGKEQKNVTGLLWKRFAVTN